ncbi:MAG: hypothetical protein RSF82_10310, partial [Angelakisella sp.]
MKLFQRTTALLLSGLLVILTGCGTQGGKSKENIVSSTRYIGQARGFFVSTGTGGEFPTERATTVEAQQQELAAMVRFAADNKLNSIFFEARPGAAAFYNSKHFPMDSSVAVGEKAQLDPLDYLCTEAGKNKVQVFAVIDCFSMSGSMQSGAKNPFAELPVNGEQLDPTATQLHELVAKGAAELCKKYGIAGVVLDGLDVAFMQGAGTTAAVEQLTAIVSAAVRKVNSSAAVAIAFDATNEHNAMTVETAQKLAQSGVVDMIIPHMNTSLEYKGDTGYLPLLKTWTAADFGTAELYTGNVFVAEDPYQIHNQLLANAMQGGVTGAVLAPYSHFATADSDENQLLISLLAAGKTVPAPTDLSFPQTLAICYPDKDTTVYDSGIYVMGTSNPALPLTIDGKDIPRVGEKGAYGVKVDLAIGDNPITIKQGDKTASVTVTRGSAPTGARPIKQITDATLFPVTPLGVDSNETVEISCVGPAGASITATMGGKTVVLGQTAKTSTVGVPATFKGSITLNSADYPADKVTNIGKITYVVSVGDSHVVQSSAAEVFVAGVAVPLTLEIPKSSYVSSVLTDLSSDDNFTQTLKSGGRAAIVGRTTATRSGNPVIAYKLSNGGYILGNRAEIVSDAALCVSNITEIVKTEGADWEQYALRGGQPAVLTERTDTTLKLRLLNTKMTADPQSMAGGIIEKVERTDTKDGVELTLTFPAGSLWGY